MKNLTKNNSPADLAPLYLYCQPRPITMAPMFLPRLLAALLLIAIVPARAEPPEPFPKVGIWMTSLPQMGEKDMNFAMLAITRIGPDGKCSIIYSQVNKSASDGPLDPVGGTVCRLKRVRFSDISTSGGRMSNGADAITYKLDGATLIIEGKLGAIDFKSPTAFRPLSRREALSVWCSAINAPPLDVATVSKEPDLKLPRQLDAGRNEDGTLARDGLWVYVQPNASVAGSFAVAALSKTEEPMKSKLSQAFVKFDPDSGTTEIRTAPSIDVIVANGEVFQKWARESSHTFEARKLSGSSGFESFRKVGLFLSPTRHRGCS